MMVVAGGGGGRQEEKAAPDTTRAALYLLSFPSQLFWRGYGNAVRRRRSQICSLMPASCVLDPVGLRSGL